MAQKGLWAEGLAVPVLLALLALVVLGLSAGAERQLVSDDFQEPDGSAPDPAMWVVETSEEGTNVEVRTRSLYTTVYDTGHASVASRPFVSNNITLLTYWQWDTGSGEVCRISLETFEDGEYYAPLTVACVGGNWRLQYYRYGSMQNVWISTKLSSVGVWYSVSVEVNGSDTRVLVREGPAGIVVASHGGFRIDPLRSHNRVVMGVVGDMASSAPSAIWDNVTVVDPIRSSNTPPRWLTVGTLSVKANLTTSFDLGDYIEDDQPGWEMLIRSASPHFVSSAGAVVDVLFTEPGKLVVVELEVNDRFSSNWTNVSFAVVFYNHPPEEDLPESVDVIEGVPYTLDLSLYVHDRNDPLEALVITVNLPYAKVDGLDLVITAPERVTVFELRLTISDGDNMVGAIITVHVTPFDSPPTLSVLPDIHVREDVAYTLDLTTNIEDTDTPLVWLIVGTSAPNCTVTGRTLRFFYTRGGFNETVTVWVRDLSNNVSGPLVVHVAEVDDPPILVELPKLIFTEDELEYVYLYGYVSDEDTPSEGLNLTCIDPNVVEIFGLTITFHFTTAVQFKQIPYSVSDGNSTTYGTLSIEVKNVNDPPEITSIGLRSPPVELTAYAMTTKSFEVVVHDEEGGAAPIRAKLTLIDAPSGVEVSGQSLRVDMPRSQVGVHTFTLVAADTQGAEDSTTITLRVLDPYSVPITITLRIPANHSTVVEGDSVTFSVEASHPSLNPTSTMVARWTSDIQGVLGTDWTDSGVLAIVVHDLEPGLHTVTVTVTQGDLTGSMWFVLEVARTTPAGSTGSDGGVIYLCIGLIVLISIMGITMLYQQSQRVKSPANTARTATQKPPPPTPTPRAGGTAPQRTSTYYVAPGRPTIEVVTPMPVSPEEVGTMPRLPTAAPAPVVMIEELMQELAPPPEEVVPVPEPEPMIAWEPPEQPVEVTPVVQETLPVPRTPPVVPFLLSREAPAPDVARLVEAIRARPGGVPHYLALFDEQSLARRIMGGKKGTDPEGRPLVQIMGDWYYSDPDDAEMFLRVYHEGT